MLLRECVAWISVAFLMLACFGIEWQRASLYVEVENLRRLEERVKEHNLRAIKRVIDSYGIGRPADCVPSDKAFTQGRWRV
jgi:hypothetical protein